MSANRGPNRGRAALRPLPIVDDPAAARTLDVAGVSDFDPEGNGEENAGETPLAHDADATTAWQTVTYYGTLQAAGHKSGVGLAVDLGTPARLSAVRLTFVGTPTSARILGSPGSTGPPTSVQGLRTLAERDGAGTRATLRLSKPTRLRYFVVWLTSLPSVSGGTRGGVAEVVPLS